MNKNINIKKTFISFLFFFTQLNYSMQNQKIKLIENLISLESIRLTEKNIWKYEIPKEDFYIKSLFEFKLNINAEVFKLPTNHVKKNKKSSKDSTKKKSYAQAFNSKKYKAKKIKKIIYQTEDLRKLKYCHNSKNTLKIIKMLKKKKCTKNNFILRTLIKNLIKTYKKDSICSKSKALGFKQ